MRSMSKHVLIAGGGIGGLAAALACARAGWGVQLWERAPAFGEVGAGIQMGPNVVRVLHDWGLQDPLRKVAAFPHRLQVRSAASGVELGVLPLGQQVAQRYGAPYATIHRADLHRLLLDAVSPQVALHVGRTLQSYRDTGGLVQVGDTAGQEQEVPLLLGADGLWSRVRQLLLGDGAPRVTGHLAYRAMVPQHSLPAALRSQQVTAWLGPDLHVIQYPVRQGDWLNVVAVVHGQSTHDHTVWTHQAPSAELGTRMADACAPLRDLVAAIADWGLWSLCDRPPMRSAAEQAQGRVALLGDAAHPMRPYLAQGAGMALEDAAQLAHSLAQDTQPLPLRLQHYANHRWQRCAQVQARSIRNGEIFHARGLLRLGRDAALRLLGSHLMDVPWLYQGGRPA
jgi:salicylate hydroxylase